MLALQLSSLTKEYFSGSLGFSLRKDAPVSEKLLPYMSASLTRKLALRRRFYNGGISQCRTRFEWIQATTSAVSWYHVGRRLSATESFLYGM